MSNLVPSQKKKGEKELTEKQKSFLEYLMSNECQGDVRKAMRAAGYSDSTPASFIINSLHEEVTELSKRVLAANSVKASMGLLSVLEKGDALGASNKIKAAKEILDRAGVVKDQQEGDLNLKVPQGGLFILPAKTPSEASSDAGFNKTIDTTKEIELEASSDAGFNKTEEVIDA